MPSSRIVPRPDDRSQRTIRRSRIVSYALVVVAAVLLSLRPDLFGDPQTQPAHALLHVWRIVVGLALVVAALGVQIAVGVQWRAGLRRSATADAGADARPSPDPAAEDLPQPGNSRPGDR